MTENVDDEALSLEWNIIYSLIWYAKTDDPHETLFMFTRVFNSL